MLLLTLLASHACGTLLSTEFYKEQLREAAVYDFIYDDLLGEAVGSELEDGEELTGDTGLVAEDIVSSLRDVLPPDWLQDQTEEVLDSVGPYLLGSADSFTYTLSLADRTDAAQDTAVSLMERVDLHNVLFSQYVPEAVDNRLGDDRELAFGTELTRDETIEAIERIVTPDFVASHQSEAAEALASYLVGRTDSFSYTFTFTERRAALEEEIHQVLNRGDLPGYVRAEVLEPALRENVTEDVSMPFGVVAPQDEVLDAIRAAATPNWVEAETLRVLDSVIPFLSASIDQFTVTVPLEDRTDAAVAELSHAVKARYAALLATVPICTSAQLRALARGDPASVCRPQGFTTEDFLAVVGIDVEGDLGRAVHEMAPDELYFTEQDLLKEFERAESLKLVEDLRTAMLDGWTFDDEKLREALAEEDDELPEALDTLRRGFREGWTWTEQDLRDVIADPDSADAEEALAALDAGRAAFSGFRIFSAVLPFLTLVMLAVIAFLGSRSWPGRLQWAGGVLFVAAFIAFVLAGPLYGATVGPAFDEAREEATSDVDDRTEILLINKILETTNQASDEYNSGVRLRALLLALLGVLAAAGGVVLGRASPPGPPATQQGAEPPPNSPTADDGGEEGAEATADSESLAEESRPEEPVASQDDAPPADSDIPPTEEPSGEQEGPEENRPG